MTEIDLHCKHDHTDSIHVFRDSDGEIAFRNPGATIFTTDEGAREFASKILDLVGRNDESGPVKVGDRVEIVSAAWASDNGKTGVLDSIDPRDAELPYRVADENGAFIAWAQAVRKVTPPTSSNPFAAHVDESKRLLAGTDYSGADVVALARELADRA